MREKDSGILGKMTIGLALVFGMLFVSGCSDSDLEQKNTQLKSNLARTESYNTSLEARLEKVTKDNSNLNKELAILRENNKGLNIALAKSELEFSKKHKEELEAERKNIEKEAYENAKNTVLNTYIGVFVGILILFVLVLIFWFFNNKKNKQIIREKEIEIEKIVSKKEESEKELKEKEEILNDLENQIKDLERMQKMGSKNQIVSMIEEYKIGRDKKLNSLGGDDHGN